MNTPSLLFNWSLQKALQREPDNFTRARVRIIFTILLFALVKAGIIISIGFANGQAAHGGRAVVAFILYIVLLKMLLYKPGLLKMLVHIMLIAGVIIVCTNIFVYADNINLLTVQFVFMMMLGSFYSLGSRWGIIYSAAGILPVILFLIGQEYFTPLASGESNEIASPAFEIIVVLNFISIAVAHYLFYSAFHVNLQEKEALNRQLVLSAAEANKLAASRSDFLSTMSHELRTPLNSVIGITELLLDDKPEERQKENLKILQSSTQDLLSLINNVLDVNKMDSDKLVLEKIPFKLSEFMRNICSGLQIRAREKHLDFILDIDEQLENTFINSDPTRLSQVLYNLVGNAIKFTEKGKIIVKLERKSGTDNKIEVLFSVTDTGIGIHQERHAGIFELFSQAESHTTRKYGGTGLGLTIVKQVLNLFNSTIQLESSPGNGTCFFFSVSFEPATVTQKILLPDEARPNLSHLRILVAEDNAVNRVILKKQLDTLDIDAMMVENGDEAYNAFLSDRYDAVFMDLHMPVTDGYEATKQIRAAEDPAKSKTYMIAFTASITEQQLILDTGFDDFLYKPVSMKDLRDKLEKIALRTLND